MASSLPPNERMLGRPILEVRLIENSAQSIWGSAILNMRHRDIYSKKGAERRRSQDRETEGFVEVVRVSRKVPSAILSRGAMACARNIIALFPTGEGVRTPSGGSAPESAPERFHFHRFLASRTRSPQKQMEWIGRDHVVAPSASSHHRRESGGQFRMPW